MRPVALRGEEKVEGGGRRVGGKRRSEEAVSAEANSEGEDLRVSGWRPRSEGGGSVGGGPPWGRGRHAWGTRTD